MEEVTELSKTVYVELSKTITEILLMFIGKFDIDKAVNNYEEAKNKLEDISFDDDIKNIKPHKLSFMTKITIIF